MQFTWQRLYACSSYCYCCRILLDDAISSLSYVDLSFRFNHSMIHLGRTIPSKLPSVQSIGKKTVFCITHFEHISRKDIIDALEMRIFLSSCGSSLKMLLITIRSANDYDRLSALKTLVNCFDNFELRFCRTPVSQDRNEVSMRMRNLSSIIMS